MAEPSKSITISTLDREISALVAALAPAIERDVSGFMRSLMASGLAIPSPIEPDMANTIYGYALGGLSRHCIERVTKKLLRGEYAQHTAFLPKPPEMAKLVRAEEAVIRRDLAHQRQLRQAYAEAAERQAKPPVSDEARERIRALVAGAVRNSDVSRKDRRHGC